MHFRYCPGCGEALEDRPMGDEGPVPYCTRCQKPFFDQFSTAIIALVVNEYEEAALLRQGYISRRYCNLVSGYMQPGERAEETARREIEEELGLPVERLDLIGTHWFEKKDMLMIGFFARAKRAPFRLSQEVDEAMWVPVRRALELVHPAGSISHALIKRYLERP